MMSARPDTVSHATNPTDFPQLLQTSEVETYCVQTGKVETYCVEAGEVEAYCVQAIEAEAQIW